MSIIGRSINPASIGRFGGFIKISRKQIRALASREGGDEDNRAVREAVRDAVKAATRGGIRDYAVQKIAAETGLSATVIRKRARIKVGTHRDRLTVWFGLNPVNLKDMKPKQDAEGVTAGPARVPGAFIVKKLGGHVFKRKAGPRSTIVKQVFDIRDKGQDAARSVYEKLLIDFEATLGRHVHGTLRRRGLID